MLYVSVVRFACLSLGRLVTSSCKFSLLFYEVHFSLICHLTECKFFIGNRQHNTLRHEHFKYKRIKWPLLQLPLARVVGRHGHSVHTCFYFETDIFVVLSSSKLQFVTMLRCVGSIRILGHSHGRQARGKRAYRQYLHLVCSEIDLWSNAECISSSEPSWPTLVLTQLSVRWIPGFFRGGKAAGSWGWQITCT